MKAADLLVRIRPEGESDHLAALHWLLKQLAQWQPDLIWTSLTRATLLGQIVGQSMNLPVVSWQDSAYLRPINQLLLRWRRKRSLLWLAETSYGAQLTRNRLGVPDERLAIWPLFSSNASAPIAVPWDGGQTLRIGSLGRLDSKKGYDVLIEALAILQRDGFRSPARFVVQIAGEGAQRGLLQARINAAALDNVTLPGFTTDPQNFLASLHLYIQPSRSEGSCIAVHEAMQAGLPIIASAVGDLPDLIADGLTGLLIPPDDPQLLVKLLVGLLKHPNQLRVIGAAARNEIIDRFSAAAFAEAGRALLARLVASGIDLSSQQQ